MSYFDVKKISLKAFKEETDLQTTPKDVPLASNVEKNIPLYDCSALGLHDASATDQFPLMSEWASVLKDGAGVIILKNAYPDTAVIDQATNIFKQIIADEKAAGGDGADHFAAAGANDRIWNSLQKLCAAAPEVHAHYFANVPVSLASQAWLGPAYQMTAQVNLVRPGGAAQKGHRDYHLGFQTQQGAARFPVHVHQLSPFMTLQGGIAHCDVPIESGATKFLPFSQTFDAGYLAYHEAEFSDHFEKNCVQLPLEKGDAIFFNPAIFHGAGENVSADIERLVNLLQVSSPFGRALENIDRWTMSGQLFAALKSGVLSDLTVNQRDAAIAATAEGYPFPTNLDTDPPIGGLAPKSQQDILKEALEENWTEHQFAEALEDVRARQKA